MSATSASFLIATACTYQNIVLTELRKGCLDDAEYFWLLVPCHTSQQFISGTAIRSGATSVRQDILSAFILEGRPEEPMLTIEDRVYMN